MLLIIVPGADWAFTISSGLRGHSAVAAVSGLMVGYAGITIVVAAGVGALVARSPALLTGLTIVGGLYLTWHGAKTFAIPSTPAAQTAAPAGTARAPWPGAWVSVPSALGLSHERSGRPPHVPSAAMIVIGALLLVERLIA